MVHWGSLGIGFTALCLVAGCSSDSDSESPAGTTNASVDTGADEEADASSRGAADDAGAQSEGAGETAGAASDGQDGGSTDAAGSSGAGDDSPEETGGEETGLGEVPNPIRIVPLGDSLTVGTSSSFNGGLDGGYRILLWQLLADAGFNVDYEGTFNNGPADFDGDHQAEDGASIEVISENWASAVGSVDPHIVLLMAGTNDQLGVTADQLPQPAAEALGRLIDQIIADKPEVVVVVAQIPPLGTGFLVGADRPARVEEYNALIPGVVAERRDAGMSVVLANLSTLDPSVLGDGIHPAQMEGYDAMARLWLPAVSLAIEELQR